LTSAKQILTENESKRFFQISVLEHFQTSV